MMASDRSPENIDDYLSRFPCDIQETLRQLRRMIKETAPEAEEGIKYGIPTFILGENLVHFAAFKNHIGFYPTPSGIEEFRDELSSYKKAKGSVQFPIDQPLPLSLIQRIVNFRVKEIRTKSGSKKM